MVQELRILIASIAVTAVNGRGLSVIGGKGKGTGKTATIY